MNDWMGRLKTTGNERRYAKQYMRDGDGTVVQRLPEGHFSRFDFSDQVTCVIASEMMMCVQYLKADRETGPETPVAIPSDPRIRDSCLIFAAAADEEEVLLLL